MTSHSAVFVTGGTGLVGRHAVSALRRAGCRVTMLMRRHPDEPLPTDVRVVQGDLVRASELTRHLRGHEVVLHAGGSIGGARSRRSLRAVFVEGTLRLLAAAEHQCVRRFVHVGSLSVLEPGPNGCLESESAMRKPTAMLPDYVRAKIDAELAIDNVRARGGLEVVVVRPGVVLGEGDRTTTPLLLRALAHPFAFGIGTGANLIPCVAAEELGDALARAVTEPGLASLCVYVTSSERITQRSLLEWHAAAAGLPMPRMWLPPGLAERAARVLEAAYGCVGAAPPVTRLAAAVGATDLHVVPGEPESRIGWRGTGSCRDAVRRAVAYSMARARRLKHDKLYSRWEPLGSGGRP
jgi:nucleoside-diphosphate-sugar epimerase